MKLFELAIISSFGVKAVVFFIYAYLYRQYRERFLGLWTLAWGFLLIKTFFDAYSFALLAYTPLLSLYQATAMFCVIFLAWGTASFVKKRLSPVWIYVAGLLLITTNICIWLNLPLQLIIIPNIIVYSLIYVYTGLILLRTGETYGFYSKKITAYAFIIIGVLQLTWPLARPDESIVHWGYLLDSFLRLALGVGFLLTYFEKTRYDLIKKEEQFRLLAENAKDIIFRLSLRGGDSVEYISPAVQQITGHSPEDFYTDPGLIQRIISSESLASLRDLAGPGASFDVPLPIRLTGKNQEEIWAEMHAVPIRDSDGKSVVAIEGIIRDVTARKQLEQELFRLDRLNIVGQMAANIGHEIRNPLTTVRGYLQVLSRKQDLAPYRDNLALLVEELDRANSLISEYLSLSKNRLSNQRPCNLNGIIDSLYPLIRADAAATNHVVNLELGDIPPLLLDEKEIRQLILNLTRNGLEAMSPGKVLTLKTACDPDGVTLAVQDQGQEIPADTLEKLGLPFFTTKENGTGLGLAICYSIANRHRAKIHVETHPGGTTFSILFPLN